MNCDIKLGCLTLHLEDQSWNRGNVSDKESDVIYRMSPEGIEAEQAAQQAQAAQQQQTEEAKQEEGKENV